MIYVKEENGTLYKVDLSEYRAATAEDEARLQRQEQAAENRREIATIKRQLAETDYQCLKYCDGQLTEDEYAPIRAYRQTLRDRINELEEGM